MRSGFVELIIKNRLAGKDLPKVSNQQRYHPVDSFRRYITQTLPLMQQSVEIDLLKQNLKKIQSPQVRKELVNAYLRRLYRLRIYEKQEMKSYKNLQPVSSEESPLILDPTILKTIDEHSEYDVGSYALFRNDDFKKMFKHGAYGNYDKNEWTQTQKFAIQIRREGLSIINVMKLLESAPKSYDWAALYKKQPAQRLQIINNQIAYPQLFQQISNYIYAKTLAFRKDQNYSRIWGNSVISDTIINTVLQNIDKHTDVFNMVDQCIDFVMHQKIPPSAQDFSKRFKQIPTTPPMKVFSKVPYFASFYYTTPSFKSIFLGGLAGTGRSMLLAYATIFAFKHNWILITVPDGYNWTQDRKATPQRMFNGLYVIQQHAIQWLDQFKTANDKILKKMQVNLQLYGKVDIAGVHQSEYDPVPNLYDPRRKTYFKDIQKQFKEKPTWEGQVDLRYKSRMTDILKNPTSIYQICQVGIKNPGYATMAMGEVLYHVYQSEHPILQCVDCYSWFFRPSYYQSFRYFNDRGLYGHIPPYHLAHCRLFIQLDGHKIKRGLKIVAASNGPLYKHYFDIKQIMLPQFYEHKVPNMTPAEFQNAGKYNILTEHWAADGIQRSNIQYMYTLAQGNWQDFQKIAQLGHYY